MLWNRGRRCLPWHTRAIWGSAAAPVAILAVWGATNSSASAAPGPDPDAPRFSVTAPARFVRGQSVVVELLLENPTTHPQRVVRPGEGPGSLTGELVTAGKRWIIPNPMASRAAPGPEALVTIPAGGRVRGTIDLTYRVLPFLNAGMPRPGNTALTLTLTYSSHELHGLPRPTWEGRLGPQTVTFETTEQGVSREERDLVDRLNTQLDKPVLAERIRAFQVRTHALESLLDRYPSSVILPLAFLGWAQEGRWIEQVAGVDRISRRIFGMPRAGKELKQKAAQVLAEMALAKRDWKGALAWSRQTDEDTRPWMERLVREQNAPRRWTLRLQLRHQEEERAHIQANTARLGRHNAARRQLEAARRARLRRLRAQVAALPRAPGEERYALSEAEMTRQREEAVKRGIVANGLRYDMQTPLESRESYQDKLYIERLEKILALRQRHQASRERTPKP